MAKERSWQMEWLVNQPAHVAMGCALALLVAWSATHVMPVLVAAPLGMLVSRLTWMAREMRQKNWQYIVWWNRDMKFVDIGLVLSLPLLWWIL